MDPATLGVISLVGGAIGTGFQMIGAYNNAQAQAAQARYQAQVAQNNAVIASQNARYASAAGEAKAEDASLRARAAVGAARAAEAANGVDVNTGSASDVQTTEREVKNLEVQRVRNNAALEAYGYRTQQTGYQAQAGLYQGQAQQAQNSIVPAVAGTLFNGVSSLGDKWVKLDQSGAFGGGGGGGFADTGSWSVA
jgi:hypothetical protein